MSPTGFIGSGRFVQAREWTCPAHDWPWTHECDCTECEREWDCETCATAQWVDLFNEDGTPRMREVPALEAMLRDHAEKTLKHWNNSILLREMGVPFRDGSA